MDGMVAKQSIMSAFCMEGPVRRGRKTGLPLGYFCDGREILAAPNISLQIQGMAIDDSLCGEYP